MYVGMTFTQQDYMSHLPRLRPPTHGVGWIDGVVSRVFSSDDRLPGWTDAKMRMLREANIIPYISCHGLHPAVLKSRLDTIPTDVDRLIIAIDHEPENDQATVPFPVWAARQRHAYEIVVSHPNRHRVLFATPLTKQYTENNGKSYFDWWTGMSDAFAVDAYLNSGGDTTSYGDPVAWCQKMLDFAARVGKPLWLAELGAVNRRGDLHDTGRADWYAGVLDTLDRSGLCDMILPWCALGTPGKQDLPGMGHTRNFHLDQRQLTPTKAITLNPAPTLEVWENYAAGRGVHYPA